MKTIFLLVLLYTACVLQAQPPDRNSSVGITFSGLGTASPFVYARMSDPGHNEIDRYFSFGVIYIRSLSNRFDMEASIEYNRAQRFYSRFLPPALDPNPPYRHESIVGVSIAARFNFWEHFFFNAGIPFSLGVGDGFKYAQTRLGIGTVFGVGVQYDFRNIPIGLFFNPYYMSRSTFRGRGNFRAEAGFRFGVVYNF